MASLKSTRFFSRISRVHQHLLVKRPFSLPFPFNSIFITCPFSFMFLLFPVSFVFLWCSFSFPFFYPFPFLFLSFSFPIFSILVLSFSFAFPFLFLPFLSMSFPFHPEPKSIIAAITLRNQHSRNIILNIQNGASLFGKVPSLTSVFCIFWKPMSSQYIS